MGSLDFEKLRQQMVLKQIRRRGITDERVLQAMLDVPREQFVPESDRPYAYEDYPLPIGHGQTISQPFTVAFQCEALQLKGDERVLEIGTGSGYAAAVLSKLAKEVMTIERHDSLASQARSTLRRLHFLNVDVHTGDGTLGMPQYQPFDAIVVTAGGKESPPEPLVEQLAVGGRLVIPLGQSTRTQTMFRFTKFADGVQSENLGGFAFVPLIGQYAWAAD